jgi:hypothetical protein
MRIVRVGTHALTSSSRTTLWNRLSQHRGSERSGTGNHRGSIFRFIVGAAILARDGRSLSTWGQGSTARPAWRVAESALEREVSQVVGRMPFVWLAIDDEPGSESLRGLIERNSIALLSNYAKDPVDPQSRGWLGSFSDRERIRESGLWNSKHVTEQYDPSFLKQLEQIVAAMLLR